jgi:hypothetical protein
VTDRQTLVIDLGGEEPLEMLIPLDDDEIAISMTRVEPLGEAAESVEARSGDV